MRLSLIGSQIARDGDDHHHERVRQPGPEIGAGGDVEIGGRRASAGALEDEQRHAAPDESGRQRGDDVGNAREGDDEAVQQSLAGAGDQDEDRAGQATGRKSACCMRLAERTFDTAIIEPIERSMPPLMTTIAWAAAASASGKAPSARD